MTNASVPFTSDGVSDACSFFSGSLGSYVNSWNNVAVNLNGVNITNTYVGSSNYPTQLDGGYYLYVESDVPWGHAEVR